MALPQFPGCQIVERVRSGPVADVYRGIQQPLGRPVLIKALSSSILPSSPFAAVLEREARLLAELHHPNIPRIYDFVRRDQAMWLVLEHVEGWSLAQLLEKVEHFEPLPAAAVMLEVVRALAHAHERDVVHRALDPRHIIISKRGEVKLSEFGVASDERLPTAPELLDGNASFAVPAYLSPEQVLGEAPEPRSDLFSVGVILYELLSGKRPFDAPDARTASQRIRHDPPAPLGRAVRGVPPALERLVQRFLQKLPSDRFYSAREAAEALSALLDEADRGAPRDIILRELHRIGVVEASPDDSKSGTGIGKLAARGALRSGLLGIAIASFAVLAGGAVIHRISDATEDQPSRSGAPLPLKPANPAYLRVVAEPWAKVVIDGQHVETTPFARPIPLTPGTHYVHLEHPKAPTERRELRVRSGENVLLDVKMAVDRPVAPDAGAQPLASALAGAPDDAGADAERPSP